MWFWGGGGGGGGVGASGALKEAIGHHGGHNGRQDFYTEEHLQALFDALHAFDCIDERNRDAAVEILRQIAELLVWGERHRNEAFFDIFCEQNILSYFVDIVNQPRVSDAVKVQLLQTLSILVQNMRRKTAIYYLFSNNYINALLSASYDFSNEEVVAWYVSFVKGLSLLITPETVKLFLNRRAPDFPVYSEAIKFFIHRDSMVRTHVRTVTLSIFKIREPIVEEFVVRRSAFFSHVACYLRAQWAERCRALRAVRRGAAVHAFSSRRASSPGAVSPRPQVSSGQSAARCSTLASSLATLRSGFAECEEFLEYIQDIFGVGVKAYNDILVERLLLFTYLPVFVGCLCRRGLAARPPASDRFPGPECSSSAASSASLSFPVSSSRSSPQAVFSASASRSGARSGKSSSSPRLLALRGLHTSPSASRLRSSPVPGQRTHKAGPKARASSPLALSARSCSSLSSSRSSSSVYSSSVCSSGESSPHGRKPCSDNIGGRPDAREVGESLESAARPSGGSRRAAAGLSSEGSRGQGRTLVLLGQVVVSREGGQQGSDVLRSRQGEAAGASDDAYGSAAEGEDNDGRYRKRVPEEAEATLYRREAEGGRGKNDRDGSRERREEKGLKEKFRHFRLSEGNSSGRGRPAEDDPRHRSSFNFAGRQHKDNKSEGSRSHTKRVKHRKESRRSRSNGDEGGEELPRRSRRQRNRDGVQSHRSKKSKKTRRESTTDRSSAASGGPSDRFSPATEGQRSEGPAPFVGDATQQLVALYLLTQTLATVKEPKLLRPVLGLLLLPRIPKTLLHLASALSPPTPAGYTALENPAQCAGAVDLFLSDGESDLLKKSLDVNPTTGGEGGEVFSSSISYRTQEPTAEGQAGLHEKDTGAVYADNRPADVDQGNSQGDSRNRGGAADSFKEAADVGPVLSSFESSFFPEGGHLAQGAPENEGAEESPRTTEGHAGEARGKTPSSSPASLTNANPPLPQGSSPFRDASSVVAPPLPASRLNSTGGEERYSGTGSFSQGCYSSPKQMDARAGDSLAQVSISPRSSFGEESVRRVASSNRMFSTTDIPRTSSSSSGGGARSAAAVIAARRPVLRQAQAAVERAFEELLDFSSEDEEPVSDRAAPSLERHLPRSTAQRTGGRDAAVGGVASALAASFEARSRRRAERSVAKEAPPGQAQDACSVSDKECCGAGGMRRDEEARECFSRRNSGGVSSTVWVSPRQMHREDEDEEEDEQEDRGKELSKEGGGSQGLEKFKSSREEDGEEGEAEESRATTGKAVAEPMGLIDVDWVVNPYRLALERFISPVTATARRSDTTLLVGGVLLHAAITHPLVTKIFLQNADILPAERQRKSIESSSSSSKARQLKAPPFTSRGSDEGKRPPPLEMLHARLMSSPPVPVLDRTNTRISCSSSPVSSGEIYEASRTLPGSTKEDTGEGDRASVEDNQRDTARKAASHCQPVGESCSRDSAARGSVGQQSSTGGECAGGRRECRRVPAPADGRPSPDSDPREGDPGEGRKDTPARLKGGGGGAKLRERRKSTGCGWALISDLLEGIRRNAAEGFLRTVTVRHASQPELKAYPVLPHTTAHALEQIFSMGTKQRPMSFFYRLSTRLITLVLLAATRLPSLQSPSATSPTACDTPPEDSLCPSLLRRCLPALLRLLHSVKRATATAVQISLAYSEGGCGGSPTSSHAAVDTFWDEWEALKASAPMDITSLSRDIQILLPPPCGIPTSSGVCGRVRGAGRVDCHTQLWREASTTKELQRRAIQQWLLLRQVWKTVGAVSALYNEWGVGPACCVSPFLAERLAAEARLILLGGREPPAPDSYARRFPYSADSGYCSRAEATAARQGAHADNCSHSSTLSSLDEGASVSSPRKSERSRRGVTPDPNGESAVGEVAGEQLSSFRGRKRSTSRSMPSVEAEALRVASGKSSLQLAVQGKSLTAEAASVDGAEEELSKRVTAPSEVASLGREGQRSQVQNETSVAGTTESYSTLLRKEEEGRSLCHPVVAREDLPVGSAGMVQVDGGGAVSVWLRGRNFIRCSVETLEGVATRYFLQSDTHLLLVSPSQTTPGRADVRMSCPLRSVECQVDSTDSRRLQLFLFTSSAPPGDVLWSRAAPQCTYASCSWCRGFPSHTRSPERHLSTPSSCGLEMPHQGLQHLNGGPAFCQVASSVSRSVSGGSVAAVSCCNSAVGGGEAELGFKERLCVLSKGLYSGDGTCRMRPALWELRVSFDDTLRCCIAAKSIQEGRNKVRSELRRYIDRLLADSNADDSLLFASPFVFPPPAAPEGFLSSRSSSFSSPSLTSLTVTAHVTRSRAGCNGTGLTQRIASRDISGSSPKVFSLFG